MLTHQISVAFFASRNELLFTLQLGHQLTYIFEAGKRIVALHFIAAGDTVNEVGGDDGFDHVLPARQLAGLVPGLQHILYQ